MELRDGPLKAILSTTGRRTGREHSVELRAVLYGGKFYFSRRSPDSDWLKNAVANPEVRVTAGGGTFSGLASLVKDKKLAQTISSLKYADKRAEESRVVLEVTPCG